MHRAAADRAAGDRITDRVVRVPDGETLTMIAAAGPTATGASGDPASAAGLP